jgi:hypothetical protein
MEGMLPHCWIIYDSKYKANKKRVGRALREGAVRKKGAGETLTAGKKIVARTKDFLQQISLNEGWLNSTVQWIPTNFNIS